MVASALNSFNVLLSRIEVRLFREEHSLSVSLEALSAKSVPVDSTSQVRASLNAECGIPFASCALTRATLRNS
jgi:Flp pilus assembly CpaE family ATPase